MLNFLIAGIVLFASGPIRTQDAPKTGHDWLMQMVGEWDTESELVIDPNAKPLKAKGTSSVRSIGGLWLLAEMKGEFMGTSVVGITTLGYDREKKRFMGTFIANMSDYLWKYDGSLDAAAKVLTLDAEGPSPLAPGKMFKYKDVYEIKNKDHKVMTSSMQLEDGKWLTFATVHFRRKK